MMKRFLTFILTVVLLLQSVLPALGAGIHSENGIETQQQFASDTVETASEPKEDELTAEQGELEASTQSQEESASTDIKIPDESVQQEEQETAEEGTLLNPDLSEMEEDSAPNLPSVEGENTVEEENSITEEEAVVEITDEPKLYNGLEPDYDDPEFLKLVQEGFFQDENTPVRALAGSIHHDSRFNGYEITKGVDVSKWNGDIDWNKAKRDGIEFAIIRCGNRLSGNGALKTDPVFDKNMRGAKNAGIKVGVYIFSQAITEAEAIEEAKFALNLCKGYTFSLPIVFDYEYYDGGRLKRARLSNTKHTSICKAFCKTIKDAGYLPMVYANKNMLEEDMYASQLTNEGYEIWLAYWTGNPSAYQGTYTYWQYSDAGKVSGFPHPCDVNYRYQLPSAKIRQLTNLHSGIRIEWNEVKPADGYRIYRKTPGAAQWKELKTIKGSRTLSCIDSSVVEGKKYVYSVQAFDGVINADFDEHGVAILRKNTLTLNSVDMTSKGIRLSWSRDDQYQSYSILRKAGKNGSWQTVEKVSVDQTSFVDESTFKPGVTYTYTIAGITENRTETVQDNLGFSVTWIDTPRLNKTSGLHNGIQIQWQAVKGAKQYRVFRKESGGRWIAIANLKEQSYIDTKAASGVWYKYTVRAYNGQTYGGYDTAGVAGLFLDTPQLKSAFVQKDGNSMTLSWKAVNGAEKYRVYRRGTPTEKWSTVGWTTKAQYIDTQADKNKTYYYTVRAVTTGEVDTVYSGYQPGIQACWAATPKLKAAHATRKGIDLTWNSVPQAVGYAVFRKTEKTGWKKIAIVKKVVAYTDEQPVAGEQNFYTVRAIDKNQLMGGYDSKGVSTIYLATPSIQTLTRNANGVKIVWGKVKGAEKYRVYRTQTENRNWETVGWSTSGFFVDTGVKNNQTYYYTVRAVANQNEKNVYSYYLKGTAIHCLAQPILKAAVRSSKGINVSWNRVTGAGSYVVYRKEPGGRWIKIANVSKGLSYLDTKAAKGRKYEYTVRARDGSFYSFYDTKGIAPAS